MEVHVVGVRTTRVDGPVPPSLGVYVPGDTAGPVQVEVTLWQGDCVVGQGRAEAALLGGAAATLVNVVVVPASSQCVAGASGQGGQPVAGSPGEAGAGGTTSMGGQTGGSGGMAGGGAPGGGAGGGMATGGTGGSALVPGLIGHWKFDEGSGSRVSDSSGRANHGTVRQGRFLDAPMRSGPLWADGRRGGADRALALNGTDEWVRVPDSDSIDRTSFTGRVSISAWVRLNRINRNQRFNVIAQRHQLATRLEHFMLGLIEGVPVTSIHHSYLNAAVSDPIVGVWAHLAMTYDGQAQRLYLNGVEVAKAEPGWPIFDDETPFTMGGGINEAEVSEHIDGLIDEVRLYDIALSADAVRELAR